jgi:hypothetical protein
MPKPTLRVLALVSIAACGESGPASRAVTRDSAGITIVESPAPDSTMPAFLVSGDPILLLGDEDSLPAEQFAQLAGALRLSSGAVVVADARAAEVRVFDSSGGFLRTIGRNGEGPGEFLNLGGVLHRGDTIAVWDLNDNAMILFNEQDSLLGELVFERLPSVTHEGMTARPVMQPRRLLSGGAMYAIARQLRINPGSGNYQDTSHIRLATSPGGSQSVGRAYIGSSYTFDTPDGTTWFGSRPFGAKGSLAFFDGGWYHSPGDRFEIREIASGDTVRRIMRVQREPVAVTDADRAWHFDSVLALADSQYRDGEREALEFAEWSTTMPTYTALVLDSEGMIWARRYPYTDPLARWEIFDPDGRLVATAVTPAQLDVRQIGPDWLLAMTKGEYDEPLVAVYRLTR